MAKFPIDCMRWDMESVHTYLMEESRRGVGECRCFVASLGGVLCRFDTFLLQCAWVCGIIMTVKTRVFEVIICLKTFLKGFSIRG